MIKFDDRYFSDSIFTKEQVKRNFENAMKDLKIAQQDLFAGGGAKKT